MASYQYRIQKHEDDWSFYIKTGFFEFFHPESLPFEELEGLNDHQIQFSGGILTFNFSIPGILATFETFTGSPQAALDIIRGIARQLKNSDAEIIEVVPLKYRIYTPLTLESAIPLLDILQTRFESHPEHHLELSSNTEWVSVQAKLGAAPQKLWSLYEMERTGGEPDVISYNYLTQEYTFIDFSTESPAGRGSLVFDHAAEVWLAENRPDETCDGSAQDMAAAMGIELLTPKQYEHFQKLGRFDQNSTTWLQTPKEIRSTGLALDGCRYGILNLDISESRAALHNPKARFRGLLKV
jgi:hypothetical protein